jgi:RHS repeat-associated protein
LAKPFYDRLNSTEVAFDTTSMNPVSTDIYPWTVDPADDVDLALTTIGQFKFAFSFDLSSWTSPNPTYTVTFNLPTGISLVSGALLQELPEGQAAVAPQVVADFGYEFTGWDVAFDNVISDLIVTAQVQLLDVDEDEDGMADDWEQQIIDADPNDTIITLADVDPNADFDGDGISNKDEFDLGSDPTDASDPNPLTSIQSSPADGEVDVVVTRETILRFSNALDSNNTIDDTVVFAEFGGQKLSARIQVSFDLDTITLFYDEPLPPSARVRVTVEGDQLLDTFGRLVDADDDGVPGGVATIDFDTLTLTSVEGTSICGRIFASELVQMNDVGEWVNEPLEGVTISVDGAADTLFAVTDPLGNFRLDPAPAGKFFVHIDGSTATNGGSLGVYYPNVGKAWTSVPGEEITVGEIFLPLVIDGTLQTVSETEDTIIKFPSLVLAENPDLAGVSITVPAGSLFANDGTSGGSVGIAPVDPDRLPGTLPDELNFPLVITVQTDGATNFDEPAPICFPNLPDPDTGELLNPGDKTGLWSFNHDAARWEVVGSMTVSADGTLVCTDSGVGILAPGWHGVAPGTPGSGGAEGASEEPPPDDKSDKGGCGGKKGQKTNPVLLYSGEKYERALDLRIKGVGMDFVWSRSYSSKIQPVTVQGYGWDFNYNIFLLQDGSGLRFCNGAGRDDLYRPIAGQTNKWSRNGFFRQIEIDENGVYRVVKADKSINEFHPFDGSPQEGKIIRQIDRNGNEIQFFYDAQGRLSEVVDTLDRSIDIAYNASGFIESVTDFIGRSVTYQYYQNSDVDGSFGDLKSVTSPAVTGTPTGNDFLDGKTTTYTYSKGFGHDRLNHNLLSITDGRRNDPSDPSDPSFEEGPYLVNVYSATTDPNNLNYDRVIRQIWGGNNVDIYYERQVPSAENNYATLKVILNDRVGNVSESFYDVGNRKVLLSEYTGRADPTQVTTNTQNRPINKLRTDDPDFYQTRYQYNANFLLTRITHPNGTITENIYESDLNPAANPRTQGNLRIKRHLPGAHIPAGDQTVIEEYFEYDSNFGCGNCGFQFVTTYTDGRGNVTSSTYDDQGNLLTRIHRISSITEEWEYNESGQTTAHIWPTDDMLRRQRDEYTYYVIGSQRGYQHEEIIDSENLALTATYTYDAVGNVITKTDPRGNTWTLVYNQLDQVVRILAPTPYSWFEDTLYDANNNVIEERKQNLVPALTANGKPQLDASGNVVMETGTPAAFVNRYEYEILNYRVTEDLDATGSTPDRLVTRYEYDGNRNLMQVTQPEGNQLEILYDERDLMFSTTRGFGSPDASTVTYIYDGNRNRVSVIDAEDTTGDGLPEVSRFEYDGYNRLVRTVDTIGNVCEYTYDANNNQTAFTCFGPVGGPSPANADGANNVLLSQTFWSYDPLDRMIQTDRLLDVSVGVTTTRALVLVDGALSPNDGFVTKATVYNDRSQIIEIFEDDGDSTTYVYDTANRLRTTTDPEGNTVETIYDSNSNTLQTIETDRSQVNPGVLDEVITTDFTYDVLNRVTRMEDNVSNITTFAFDSRDNQTVVEDAEGNTTETIYDGANRMLAQLQALRIDGSGDAAINPGEAGDGYITTSYQYDGNSRLQSFTDDNGNRKVYTYDALNRPALCTYGNVVGPLLADRQDSITTEEWIYDKDDNLITFTDQNHTVHTYQYDGLNRQLQHSMSIAAGNPFNLSGTTLQVMEYDGLSRKTRCTDNNDPSDADDDIVCTYAYDTLSRVLEEGQSIGVLPARVTTPQYDNSLTTAGNHQSTAMVYPDGRIVEQTYDANNRIRSIADAGQTPIITYDYIGSANRVERKSLQNGIETDLAYDGIRRVLNLETRTNSDDLIVGFEHGYNRTHQKLYERKLHDLNNSELYTYDSAYRLRNFERGSLNTNNDGILTSTPATAVLQSCAWTLDGLGNWDFQTFTNQGSSPTDSIRTDTNFNEIATLGGAVLLYDDNGNQTDNADAYLYEWDALNRLKVVRDRSDTTIIAQYDYDFDNRRMRKTVSNRGALDGTTHYYYNGSRVCEELAWFGMAEMLIYQYVWGATYLHELVARDHRVGVSIAQLNDGVGGERQFQHGNTLHSIFAVTDENEAILERYQYDPYGTHTVIDANFNVLATSAIAQEYTDTGHRNDFETGLYYCFNRYFDSQQGQWLSRDPIAENGGINLYAYVLNNPINLWDLLGMFPNPTPFSNGHYQISEINPYLRGNPSTPSEMRQGSNWPSLDRWNTQMSWLDEWKDDQDCNLNDVADSVEGFFGDLQIGPLGDNIGDFASDVVETADAFVTTATTLPGYVEATGNLISGLANDTYNNASSWVGGWFD